LGTGRSRSKREEPAAPASRRRLIFLVSREAIAHYEYLRQAFQGEEDVEVILDRRRGERRGQAGEPGVERRRRDRRVRPNAEDRLRALGWSIVEVHPVR
jgi:hypothetical protein